MLYTLKVSLIAFLALIMTFGGVAEAYQLDRLFREPSGTSEVVYQVPSLVRIAVEQLKDYDTAVWVLLDVQVGNFGHYHGWLYVPKEIK